MELMRQSKDIEWKTGYKKKKKKCLQYSACTETQLRAKDAHRLKVRGWRNIFHTNRNGKLMGDTVLTLAKIDTDK